VARATRLADGQLVLIVEVEKMLSQADLMVRKDTTGGTVLGSTEAVGARPSDSSAAPARTGPQGTAHAGPGARA
jgi:hypothetical protein